ncbi:MAG: class I SAM-dependent methyltransferase [Acidimicrobiia bacterium]|nr:class I SAM-dependent methyltransferase [Acidimicrobiia bacterium]
MADDARDSWNVRHAARAPLTEPATFVAQSAALLPTSGSALDVAGGTGRNALWLAAAGLTVTLTDVSDVALDLARADAATLELPVDTIRLDLEEAGLPDGVWDVIVVHHFLERAVLQDLPDHLASGGLVIVAHPTRRNLERHRRPGPRYLLDEGELASIVASWSDMEIITIEEGWTPEGRHEARVRARKR